MNTPGPIKDHEDSINRLVEWLDRRLSEPTHDKHTTLSIFRRKLNEHYSAVIKLPKTTASKSAIVVCIVWAILAAALLALSLNTSIKIK